jgi:hypothetical protein
MDQYMDPVNNKIISPNVSPSLPLESEEKITQVFEQPSIDDSFIHKTTNRFKKFSPLEHKETLRKAGLDFKALEKITLAPLPDLLANSLEKDFIKTPTTESFYTIVTDFEKTMTVVGHQKYAWLADILITPGANAALSAEHKNEQKIEHWHNNHKASYNKNEHKALTKTTKRNLKTTTLGPGVGGKASKKINEYKEDAFYMKNNLTIRGNIFQLDNAIFSKNLYEIMPRFGYRKTAHIGVRTIQFVLNSILSLSGYSFLPVTFGISKVAADQVSTAITLTGETITYKIAGADNEKIAFHNGLRGLQLELPYIVPGAGQIVSYAESAFLGTAAFGIVSTTLADAILAQTSTRYTSKINLDDLGDSRCIEELNNRIDYLSRFLLPYGQYLLLKESDLKNRNKLKKTLKGQYKTLRDLEKKKVESLNFYRLGLIADRIPKERSDTILNDCKYALPDIRINTHRMARACLATLIQNDEGLRPLLMS